MTQLGLLVLATSAGCSRHDKTYPVHGRVVYTDGSTVSGGVIELQSVDRQPPLSARGKIGTDGMFVLGTFAFDDGAVAGTHRAIVLPAMRAAGDTTSKMRGVAARFASYGQSGLQVTVETCDNDITITVEQR